MAPNRVPQNFKNFVGDSGDGVIPIPPGCSAGPLSPGKGIPPSRLKPRDTGLRRYDGKSILRLNKFIFFIVSSPFYLLFCVLCRGTLPFPTGRGPTEQSGGKGIFLAQRATTTPPLPVALPFARKPPKKCYAFLGARCERDLKNVAKWDVSGCSKII